MGVTGHHARVRATIEQTRDGSYTLMSGGAAQGSYTVRVRLVDIQSKLITKPRNQLGISSVMYRAVKQGLALVASPAKVRAQPYQLPSDRYRRGLAKRSIQGVSVFDSAIYIDLELLHREPDALYRIVVMQQIEDDRVAERRYAHDHRQERQQADRSTAHSSIHLSAVRRVERFTGTRPADRWVRAGAAGRAGGPRISPRRPRRGRRSGRPTRPQP